MSLSSAVLICNFSEDIHSMNPGSDGDQVTIPTGMSGETVCNLIKTVLEDGITVEATFQNVCEIPDYGSEVFWGRQTGTGDFNSGLGDWEVLQEDGLGVNTWHFSQDAYVQGFYGEHTMNSHTACNGVAVMNSDSLDNGNTDIIGSGPCPAPCIADLISPIIPLDEINTSNQLSLQFSQAVRDFDSGYQLLLSKDGGITYPEVHELNLNVIQNNPGVELTTTIQLNGYETTDLLRFKFRYSGNYYYWMIDDVILLNEGHTSSKDNLEYKTFDVFPNPATDQVNVSIVLRQSADIKIDLVNLHGLNVFSTHYEKQRTDEITFSTSEIPSGVYLLRISSDQGTTSQKLVIR